MRIARWIGSALAVAWTVVLVSPDILAQCAMCRTALNGDPDPLARAISVSVIFMVSMPFMVVGSIAGWIVLSLRKAGRGETLGPAYDVEEGSPLQNPIEEGSES